MTSILEKMRKARESVVESCGHRFTIRRPTDLEVQELQARDGGMTIRNSLRFVVGWDLKEIDLVPGGAPDDVPFDQSVFTEWAEDKPAVWPDILEALKDSYFAHVNKLESEAGN